MRSNSPADKAGLCVDDVIVSYKVVHHFNSHRIDLASVQTLSSFRHRVTVNIENMIAVTIWRPSWQVWLTLFIIPEPMTNGNILGCSFKDAKESSLLGGWHYANTFKEPFTRIHDEKKCVRRRRLVREWNVNIKIDRSKLNHNHNNNHNDDDSNVESSFFVESLTENSDIKMFDPYLAQCFLKFVPVAESQTIQNSAHLSGFLSPYVDPFESIQLLSLKKRPKDEEIAKIMGFDQFLKKSNMEDYVNSTIQNESLRYSLNNNIYNNKNNNSSDIYYNQNRFQIQHILRTPKLLNINAEPASSRASEIASTAFDNITTAVGSLWNRAVGSS